MVEAASSDNNYDDPVYQKFKNVLKGAEMVRLPSCLPSLGKSCDQVPARTLRVPPHRSRQGSDAELPLCQDV